MGLASSVIYLERQLVIAPPSELMDHGAAKLISTQGTKDQNSSTGFPKSTLRKPTMTCTQRNMKAQGPGCSGGRSLKDG